MEQHILELKLGLFGKGDIVYSERDMVCYKLKNRKEVYVLGMLSKDGILNLFDAPLLLAQQKSENRSHTIC